MSALAPPVVLPKKPVFQRAAVALAGMWLLLSTAVPVVTTELSDASLLFLAQFFLLNGLLLAHARRGDTVAYRAWTFMQLGYTLVAFTAGSGPADHGSGAPWVDWAIGAISALACACFLYPLTFKWYADVRDARRAASPAQKLLEARAQMRLALVWGAVAPISLQVGSRLEGPQLLLVLAVAALFAVIGFALLVLSVTRIYRLSRVLSS